MSHFNVSMFKSIVRCIGYMLLLFVSLDFILVTTVLVISEFAGIIEEIV